MNKTSLFICFILWARSPLVAQTVRNPERFHISGYDIKMYPSDNFLFAGYNNFITIKAQGRQVSLLTNNGVINALSNEVFVISNVKLGSATLSVTTGKTNVATVLVRNYSCIDFPDVKIAGVRCDSAITQMGLASGSFYAEFKNHGRYKVRGFVMDIMERDTFLTDTSHGARLTPRMVRYIGTLKPGSVVTFRELKFTTSDGMSKINAFYRVFVVRDEDEILSLEL